MMESNPKRPVILQVLPSLVSGGVERGTIEINRAIARQGWKGLVVSSGGPLVPAVKHTGGEHIEHGVDSKNAWKILRNIGTLEKIIREHKVDIVHARSRAPAWSAYYAAKRTGAHFVTTFHGVYGLKSEWKRRYNAMMTRGERVIAVSHFVARHIRENYPVDEDRIRVIHRGVDLKIFNPAGTNAQRMAELARSWLIPEDLPVILFPGRITRWKGQDVFIKALGALPHRNFIALMVGDDTGHEAYRQTLEALVVEHKLEGHVRFVGATNSMAEAYKLARFVVATSVEPEAFGRVVLEAQAMGRPVIATNHGGVRETVLPDVTGWLVEPGNVESLTTAIDRVLNLPEDEMAQVSRQAVTQAEHFSAELMCDRTIAVYQELL